MLIMALSVYRITLIVHKEAGPFDMFGRFRTWAGVTYDAHSNPVSNGEMSAAILCPLCLSVWIGIGVTIAWLVATYFNGQDILMVILLPFALSGLSVFAFKWTGI